MRDLQAWINLGALITALVPFLTAAAKKVLGSTKYNALLPLAIGVISTAAGAMATGQVRGVDDLVPIVLTGLIGGGVGSSARDVWAKTMRGTGTGPAAGIVLLAVLLSGCMATKNLTALAKELAHDNASVCIAAWVGVGGGAVVPAPTVPAAGGWGYIIIGRTNETGSTMDLTNDRCQIQHGTVLPSVVITPAQ